MSSHALASTRAPQPAARIRRPSRRECTLYFRDTHRRPGQDQQNLTTSERWQQNIKPRRELAQHVVKCNAKHPIRG